MRKGRKTVRICTHQKHLMQILDSEKHANNARYPPFLDNVSRAAFNIAIREILLHERWMLLRRYGLTHRGSRELFGEFFRITNPFQKTTSQPCLLS